MMIRSLKFRLFYFGRLAEWFIALGLNPSGGNSPPSVRIGHLPLASKEALLVYSVMVTSYLAMVEFRVRFPIDDLNEIHPANQFG